MIDHAGQVAPALAVGHLVDTDHAKAIEAIGPLTLVLGDDALEHPPDRRPVDPHEAGDHALWRIAGQPDGRVLEGPGEARSGPGEGDLFADHAALGAVDAPHLHAKELSLIHISEPTRLGMISYAVFC